MRAALIASKIAVLGLLMALGPLGPARAHPVPALVSSAQPQPLPMRQLSTQEARADVALMRRALETIHPGLYRRTPKPALDSAFADLEHEIGTGITDVQLYRRISLILAMIRCTHTKADQPEAIETWRLSHPSHLPFRFRLIAGRMLIVSSDPGQAGPKRGAEILAINGRPVAKLVKTLGAYVPIDGFTEDSRAAYLANDGDLMGADFDHFYPYVFGFSPDITLRLREGGNGLVREMTMSLIPFTAWLNLANDGQPYRQDFKSSTYWRLIEPEIGYLRVDTFVNYRAPIDAAALYGRALTQLYDAGARKLILDLRANGGGSNDAALALIDALAIEPYTYQRAILYRAVRYGDLPQYISSWGNRAALFEPKLDRFLPAADGRFALRPELAPELLQQRQPTAGAFRGPVIVLTSPANASGATMVIAKLRDMGRVRLIGEPSGGSADGPTAGTIFNVKLPNSGISVRVPLVFNQMEVVHFAAKGGIAPDVRVPTSVADFRTGKDRALARALTELAKTPTAP